MVKVKSWFLSTLYVDLRSLALCRVLAAILYLTELYWRYLHRIAFYSSQGVNPRFDFMPRTFDPFITINSEPGLTLFFAMGLITGVLFLLGAYTRVACVICWLILLSLHARWPFTISLGDDFTHILFFIMIFLPMDKYFSVNAYKRSQKASPRHISAFATLLFFQLAIAYFCSAIFKVQTDWLLGFEGLIQPFNSNIFTTPFGKLFAKEINLLKFGAVFVIVLELFVWTLFLIPSNKDIYRWLTILTFTLFHALIWASFNLGFFSAAMIIAWLIFLPTNAWEKEKTSEMNKDSAYNFALASLFGGSILLWNIITFLPNDKHPFEKVEHSFFEKLIYTIQLDQQWNMFAVESGVPWPNHFWRAQATLTDGTTWDIFHNLPYKEISPSNFYDMYPNIQWFKFLHGLAYDRVHGYRTELFAHYLCRTWNEANTLKARSLKLYLFQNHIDRSLVWTPLEKKLRWDGHCPIK